MVALVGQAVLVGPEILEVGHQSLATWMHDLVTVLIHVAQRIVEGVDGVA